MEVYFTVIVGEFVAGIVLPQEVILLMSSYCNYYYCYFMAIIDRLYSSTIATTILWLSGLCPGQLG